MNVNNPTLQDSHWQTHQVAKVAFVNWEAFWGRIRTADLRIEEGSARLIWKLSCVLDSETLKTKSESPGERIASV